MLACRVPFPTLPAASFSTGISTGELSHSPRQPRSGQAVLVRARIPAEIRDDPVTLQYQVVEPGRYIRKSDPEFQRGWRDVPMFFAGAGDGPPPEGAGGGRWFRTVVPGHVQSHRRLLRYRVAVGDPERPTWTWPDRTNACPNQAWFVYDGQPPWTGASRPDRSESWTFSSEFLGTLSTYHLIADAEDVAKSQWDGAFNRQPFSGTLVYEGQVYDHIQFHNRGQASTYVAGKNKWGFRFTPGHGFQARDRQGKPFARPWGSFNLNACASPWAPVNRGMAGLDEAISYRAYALAGVPSPEVFWVQLRVIAHAAEVVVDRPYEGDSWGLYLVVEEKNGDWLRRLGLPEGNLFSAEGGPKHLVTHSLAAEREMRRFVDECSTRPSVGWWRSHLDLDAYFSFHALNRLLANIDLRPGGNHYLYQKPEGRWVVLPHDLDMMFIPKTHQPGVTEQSFCLEQPTLHLAYRNRAREILDLLGTDARPNGGQIGQLVEEMTRVLRPPGQVRNWAELDEARWNWHPRSNAKGAYYQNPYRDRRMGGTWTRTLATPDFAGFTRYILEFCTDSRPTKGFRINDGNPKGYGFGYLASEAWEPDIPATPRIRYSGAPGYPVDRLKFVLEPYSPTNSAPYAAWEFRMAEIAAPGLVGFQAGDPWRYELETVWTTGPRKEFVAEVAIPPNVAQPSRHYRFRVRHRDSMGRWSHWSEPVSLDSSAPPGSSP